MDERTCFENYPLSIVVISNIQSLSIWIIGFYILSGISILISMLFLAYCLIMEFRVLTRSCVNCYYYGKVCFSGKGKVCALLFKKGDSRQFIRNAITWKDILPDFMVSIIPTIGGIALLIISFSWLILVLMIVLLLLSTVGTATVRESLACKYCRQRDIGCPAQKLFEKRNMENPD